MCRELLVDSYVTKRSIMPWFDGLCTVVTGEATWGVSTPDRGSTLPNYITFHFCDLIFYSAIFIFIF